MKFADSAIIIYRMLPVIELLTWCLLCMFAVDKAMCHPNIKTVCVQCYSSGVVQKPSCNDTSTVDCHQLEKLPEVVSNFTVIQFQSGLSFLQSKISFTDLHNLTLLGSNGSTILCTGSKNAGFMFFGVSNLFVKDFQFIGCGTSYFTTTNNKVSDSCSAESRTVKHILLVSTLFLFKCSTVTLDNIHIRKINGSGVVMRNTFGSINVNNCTFENKQSTSPNSLSPIQRGHGVYVEFGRCSTYYTTSGECAKTQQVLSTTATGYHFSHCSFQNNIATVCTYKEGGGLAIFLKHNSSNITVSIDHCKFINNTAVKGGGLRILFEKRISNNTVLIRASHFIGNRATSAGGGLHIESCERGLFPGSFDIFNCTWSKNQAKFGAAVAIGNYRAHLTFQSCLFVNNSVEDYFDYRNSAHVFRGKGAVYSYHSTLTLNGTHTFFGNNGSAVYLTKSVLKCHSGSHVEFLENSGINGGAIYLKKQSQINLSDNINVSLFNNTADNLGGAIFQEDSPRLTFPFNSRAPLHCVFVYDGQTQDLVEQRNVSFFFGDNNAGRLRYNSIFVSTLQPCKNSCSNTSNSSKEYFSCIGSFNYVSKTNGSLEISTKGSNLITLSSLEAIPGKKTVLPVELTDELNQKIQDKCQLVMKNTDSEEHSKNSDLLKLSSNALEKCSETTVILNGAPGQSASLFVKTDDLFVSVTVYVQECPPGYIFINSTKNCICSAIVENTQLQYDGIDKCNEQEFKAHVKRGYWIGYEGNEKESDESLIVAHCPYCHSHDNFLPSVASRQDLNKFMCEESHRTGIVCGKCVENHTTLFRSNNFECYKNTHYCKYGILFYILSEWIPVTVLFILVILLNVSFTTGAVNGFVFFAQFIVSTHSIGFLHLFDTYPDISRFSDSVLMMYRMFNLDFFSMKELSFCIWRGAGALQVLAMKYVTVVYSFVLVVLTILAMRICKLPKFLTRSKKDRFRSSVVHGLSSFFVMCYSQCASISIQILTSNLIKGKGDISSSTFKRRVVFYDGEMEYFHLSHLPYAIPAVFFMLIFVLIPPILLIVYPLCYKLFGVLKISENKVTMCCRCIPLERIRPLFDSMQSCYKDSCRYFSGLYFFYRIMPLIMFAWTKNDTFYGVLQLGLIIVFGVHSIVQPYKVRWHNWIDSLLFIDLLLINALTIWIYLLAIRNFNNYQGVIVALCSFQTVLTLLPLVYLILYFLVCMAFKLKARFNTKSIDNEDHLLELSPLHNRNFEDFSIDHDYQRITQ